MFSKSISSGILAIPITKNMLLAKSESLVMFSNVPSKVVFTPCKFLLKNFTVFILIGFNFKRYCLHKYMCLFCFNANKFFNIIVTY